MREPEGVTIAPGQDFCLGYHTKPSFCIFSSAVTSPRQNDRNSSMFDAVSLFKFFFNSKLHKKLVQFLTYPVRCHYIEVKSVS